MSVQTQVRVIDPQEALRILDECKYEGQRPVRKRQVARLASAIEAGKFLPTQSIALAQNGGEKQYLINGQHTLTAIVKSGKPLSLPVHVHQVSNSNELADLYAAYDRGLSRSFSDSAMAHQWAHTLGISSWILNKYHAAAKVVKLGFLANTREGMGDFEDAIFEYETAMRTYVSLVKAAGMPVVTESRWYRKGVFSVALATLHYKAQGAEDFWCQAALDDGLSAGDARKFLNKHVLSTVVAAAGRMGQKSKHRPGAQAISADYDIRFVVRAWNAYYKGETLKMIKVVKETAPIIIAGTPFQG